MTFVNKKVNNIDQQAGVRIAVIENFLDALTTQQQGQPSLYKQYIQSLQTK